MLLPNCNNEFEFFILPKTKTLSLEEKKVTPRQNKPIKSYFLLLFGIYYQYFY